MSDEAPTEEGERLRDLFRTSDRARDNFLSRLFGMFSEDVARCWARNPENPAYGLVDGRPTLWAPDRSAFATLDLTLRSKADGQVYVAEQKAEMAFEGYRYLVLERADQIAHHAKNRAFAWLLEVAGDPTPRLVQVAGKPIDVSGAILVWGAVEQAGREAAMDAYGFADVLSLEDMVDDLRRWEDRAWTAHVDEIHRWADALFEGVGMPERVRLRRLGAWADRFSDPAFSFGRWVEPVETSPGHFNVGYYAFTDEAEAFIQEMYDFGWVRPFDWMPWANSPAGSRLHQDRVAIGEASADELWKVVTMIVRADWFSDSALATAYDHGILLAIAQRARTLSGLA